MGLRDNFSLRQERPIQVEFQTPLFVHGCEKCSACTDKIDVALFEQNKEPVLMRSSSISVMVASRSSDMGLPLLLVASMIDWRIMILGPSRRHWFLLACRSLSVSRSDRRTQGHNLGRSILRQNALHSINVEVFDRRNRYDVF